jgi:DNA-binding transcriptional ArsR family regulator
VATRTKAEKNGALSARELRAIAKALSDPRRFQILKHIAAQSCAACSDLRAAFPITAATLSHHLKELESAGLIATVGAVDEETIKAYIENQKWDEDDQGFKITAPTEP